MDDSRADTTAAMSTVRSVRHMSFCDGQLMATILHRVWAQPGEAPPCTVGEINRANPLLLKSGAGALAWSRVRQCSLASSPAGLQLHEAYRLHALQSEIHLGKIKKTFSILQNSGMNPVLVKGWAIARLYPEPGLRPYGDIDLCVPANEFARTQQLLAGNSLRALPVDLHSGFTSFGANNDEEFLKHTQTAMIDDVSVRVLGPEHHLRALCLHMLRHGAFRPLWLVDIAVAVENRAKDFDWQLCLGADRRRADWVACAIGLAHRLIGARVEDTPVAERAGRLPRWLVKQVLKAWSNPEAKNHGVDQYIAPMNKYLRDPRGLIADLRNRWPDPIEATISVGGSFNSLPRVLFQLVNCVNRAARFAKRLPRSWSEGRRDKQRELIETTDWALFEGAPE